MSLNDCFRRTTSCETALQKVPYGYSMGSAWCWKWSERERGRFSLTLSLSLKYPHVKEKAAVVSSAICALPEATQLGPT